MFKNLFSQVSKKRGLAPGELVPVSHKEPIKSECSTYEYSAQEVNFKELGSKINTSFLNTENNLWVNIDGVSDVEYFNEIKNKSLLSSLILEDVMNTSQRSKIEEHDNDLFLVLKMLHFDRKTHATKSEQVSFILKENVLLSFQEENGDTFEYVRERLKNPESKLRKRSADYLLYALIDSIVDHYFLVLENIEPNIEKIEEEIFSTTTSTLPKRIIRLKNELLFLRKNIYPLKDVLNLIINGEFIQIKKENLVFYRDVHDHVLQILDAIDLYKETLISSLELYDSLQSQKMNEIMKFLTIFASIFIPLTFVAGIYGMNFENMPELKHPLGYFICLAAMGSVLVSMLFFFKKKKWF